MFSHTPIYGTSLPPDTLCLTFDDGPGVTVGDGRGPKTLKLAEWLASENIQATFFMVGRHIVEYPEVLPRVFELGHIIGNHAFTHHRTFSELLERQWNYISEVELTDKLIAKYLRNNDIYFRAPWGDFPTAVANGLNKALGNRLNHIGSFMWDIGAGDWNYWENGRSAEECAQYYFDEIKAKNHGIVLMHDSTSDLLNAKNNNLTYETIRILIPELKRQGYQFVNLDSRKWY